MGAALCLSTSAFAVSLNVNTTSCGTLPTNLCNELEGAINSLFNEDLPEVSLGEYGTGIANAQGFTYKGLGSDYSDVFDYFVVRGGAGASLEGDSDNVNGFGAGAAATIGLNLDILPVEKVGPIELDKMDLFVSFMSYSPEFDQEDISVKGDISHFSIMARYQLIEGKDWVPGNMLKWGGLFLHTGFQRSSIEADATQSFSDEVVEIGGGQTATMTNTTANFTFETSNTSIPVEVSTYIRTAWALTFFGGAGFDFVTGSTDISLNASGNAVGDGSTGGYTATISADEDASGDADATNFRAFIGGQLNLPFVRLYTHFNKGLGNDLVGASAGLKILW